MDQPSLILTDQQHLQPSFIELIYKDSLDNAIEPGLKHLVAILSKFNSYVKYVYDQWDQFYPLCISLFEFISLKLNGGMIAETIFEIQRVNTHEGAFTEFGWGLWKSFNFNNSRISPRRYLMPLDQSPTIGETQLSRSLSLKKILIIVFYSAFLPHFSGNFFANMSANNEVPIMNQNRIGELRTLFLTLWKDIRGLNFRRLIYFFNKIFHQTCHGSGRYGIYICFYRIKGFLRLLQFFYRVFYSLDRSRWPYWDPSMHFMRLIYLGYDKSMHQSKSSEWTELSIKVFKILFIFVAKCFLLFEWFYSNREILTKKDIAGYIPVPPKDPPLSEHPQDLHLLVENKKICPLCLRERTTPTCIPTGYVFCYRCITDYLSQKQQCPITGVPLGNDQVRRLYESS